MAHRRTKRMLLSVGVLLFDKLADLAFYLTRFNRLTR
jgi:hypothetical protein